MEFLTVLESALEKVKAQKINFGFMERFNVDENWEVMKALEEIQQYRAIGTIEELQALKEKAEPRKPICNDLCTCPSCSTHNEVIKKRRNTVVRDTVYCWYCGQAMEIERLE